MVSKLFIETIEDLDKKILESLDAAGCNTFQKIRYGILPQLFTNFVSKVIYWFEINIKDAYTLGLVVLVLIVEYVSTKVRNKLARG